jgi:hypothetical protein
MSLSTGLEALAKGIANFAGPNPDREQWVQLIKDAVALIKKNAPDALSSEEQAAIDAEKAKTKKAEDTPPAKKTEEAKSK